MSAEFDQSQKNTNPEKPEAKPQDPRMALALTFHVEQLRTSPFLVETHSHLNSTA